MTPGLIYTVPSMTQSNIKQSFQSLLPILENTPVEGDFLTTDTLIAVHKELENRFDDDAKHVESYKTILFDPNIEHYGESVTEIFSEWDDNNNGPRMLAFVAHAIEQFELPIETPLTQSLLLSAVLAEVPNDMQYHGNNHYRKVVFHIIRLISKHNQIFAGKDRVLNKNQITTLLTAACIHDIGHKGSDNLRDGVYTPGALEQKSFDMARPYFEALNIDPDHRSDIETIVFCTDITFFAGDNSPCIRMKQIFRYHFWDDKKQDISMMTLGKLRRYDDNPHLVLMAMLMHEADIATSAGVSYEQTIKETINIMEERGAKIAGPEVVLAFLREQLGQTMFTEAARQIFGKSMDSVIEQAEADVERGRKTFYED